MATITPGTRGVGARQARGRGDDVRRGTHTVVLVDAALDRERWLTSRLRERGVSLLVYRDVLRGLARVGAGDVDALVLSAQLGGDTLLAVVEVAHEELGVAVLVAHGPGETDIIGPAVLAGARPMLTRPYGPAALETAVREVRQGPVRLPTVQVGRLRLDVAGYDAQFGNQGIDLATLEFEALYELASQHDHVVEREALQRRFWPTSSDPNAALIAVISRLRRKLDPFGAAGALHTVRGIGYRLDSTPLMTVSVAGN